MHSLDRRQFLGGSLCALSASFAPRWMRDLDTARLADPTNDNLLVVLQLAGGYDGLAVVTPHEDDVYYRVRWVPLAGSEGEMLAVITDVTAGAQRELELEYLARVDPLTALGNRAAIVGRLDDSLKRLERARPGDGVAVVMIDLDHFKPVNDHYGHAAGDALLVEVGKQLTASLRGHDAVGRIGGDEFMIVCERVAGAIDAESIAARVADRLDGISIVVDSTKVSVVGRVGLAWTTEPTDGASLMAAADERLYAAKRDRSGPRFLIANSAPAGT